jgi:hypothetical protein
MNILLTANGAPAEITLTLGLLNISAEDGGPRRRAVAGGSFKILSSRLEFK